MLNLEKVIFHSLVVSVGEPIVKARKSVLFCALIMTRRSKPTTVSPPSMITLKPESAEVMFNVLGNVIVAWLL